MDEISSLLEETRKQASEELEDCNPKDTPYVCEMIITHNGKEKILDLIMEYVGNNGMSIAEAINTIEKERNPRTQD